VIIDQHYKISHPEMSYELILELIKNIDSESAGEQFDYYKIEPLYYLGDPYRLIFVLERDEDYLGVMNAFRVRRINGIPK
jgi:hypothetical protein